MNTERVNPFNELYVTETIPPEHFVSLFSPFLVNDAQDGMALFQPGNVVVKGIQGSGKSMLLNLLKPEIRIAYKKANASLPIPARLSKFIGAGINLTRSVAIDFGQRAVETSNADDLNTLPLYFGDFFNYWIVDDILNSIEKLKIECDGRIARDLNISENTAHFDEFALLLADDPCWFNYLRGVRSYSMLRERLAERISIYRAFLNFNLREGLPEDIKTTKTSIGEPISRTVEALWQSNVVPRSVPFFIRIDQYEELSRLEHWSVELGLKYRRIINKALGLRDPRVSYRIGTRRYAWGDDLQIYGTASTLELERDYKLVDIDEVLRRKENRRTWVFPGFADDVFNRRVSFAGYKVEGSDLKKFLGDGLSPEQKADSYARTSPSKVVGEDWPSRWKKLFVVIAAENPLSAKLAEAWVRQNIDPKTNPSSLTSPFPWETRAWWRKERIQQALMLIAWQYRQRLVWSGKDEVLALSGGNILVFVSICQQIWASWSRSTNRSVEEDSNTLEIPTIHPAVQAIGIQEASTLWYNKIPEKTGRSNQRQRFVNFLGRLFRQSILDDKSMSYPGHNGFSLRIDELISDEEVQIFLNDAVNYGDLFDASHTTKLKNRLPRRKWYLNPILSPHFQLPVSHVKEPMYVSVNDVRNWLVQSEQVKGQHTTVDKQRDENVNKQHESQLPLFFGEHKGKVG